MDSLIEYMLDKAPTFDCFEGEYAKPVSINTSLFVLGVLHWCKANRDEKKFRMISDEFYADSSLVDMHAAAAMLREKGLHAYDQGEPDYFSGIRSVRISWPDPFSSDEESEQ